MIADAGYNAIQVSPIQKIRDPKPIEALNHPPTGPWWLFYQPCGFNTIGNYKVGSESDFRSLCEEAEEKGIKIIVDVVLNHIADTGLPVTGDMELDPELPRVASCYYVPRFVARYLTWNGEPSQIVENVVRSYSTWLFNHFDRVVFSTAAHRQFFAGDGLLVPTTVISNGVDVGRYAPGDRYGAVEQKYHLRAGSRILFVSRLAKDKEIHVLIEAMQHLGSDLGAELLLVGRGDDEPRLRELTDELGLGDHVRFLGFVPEADLPVLYRASDLFAIASICEVQSLPTLQAAATGLPVVAADAVALPELVHNGVNGFLVPPADPEGFARAMEKILRDRALARQMGAASLGIAQEHAEERTFDRYESLWLQAVEEQSDS